MILLAHLLFGAVIGSLVKNIYLAVILAFLSHYLLDILPHIEYPIENIHPVKYREAVISPKAKLFDWVKEKQWKRAIPQIITVILDFLAGILLIILLSKNYPIIYACAFFAILPDGFTVLNIIFPTKFLEPFQKFHQKIHFLKNNSSTSSGQIKISNFWRISSQIIVAFISIIILKL